MTSNHEDLSPWWLGFQSALRWFGIYKDGSIHIGCPGTPIDVAFEGVMAIEAIREEEQERMSDWIRLPAEQPSFEDPKDPQTYLGDGVYASFDGYHIWLDLRAQPGPRDHVCKIALEPCVFDQLIQFRDRLIAESSKDKESSNAQQDQG